MDQLRARQLGCGIDSTLAVWPNRRSIDEASTVDDAKAKFREALEKKKAAAGGRGVTPGGTGAIHGEHVKAGGKREFRRKSGS